jgi:hypothetical protein
MSPFWKQRREGGVVSCTEKHKPQKTSYSLQEEKGEEN